MTKEEAIQILSTRDAHGVLCGYTSGVTEALDMAINALSTEPNCKDCKKRNNTTFFMDDEEALDRAIEALSANRLHGEWIKHKGKWVDFDFYPTKYECSQCHYCVDEGCDSIFCPNCGARMKAR